MKKKKLINYASLDKKSQKQEKIRLILFIITIAILFILATVAIVFATWNPDFIKTIIRRNTLTGVALIIILIGATLSGLFILGKGQKNYGEKD